MTSEAGQIPLTSGEESTFYMRGPRYASWEPKEDITAYELARAMPILLTMAKTLDVGDYVDGLPPAVARHFRVWLIEKKS